LSLVLVLATINQRQVRVVLMAQQACLLANIWYE